MKTERFTRVACYIFNQCSENSSEGNWTIEFDDVEEFFGFKINRLLFDRIVHFLYRDFGFAVLDVSDTFDERVFDITLGTDYIINNDEVNLDYNEPFNPDEEFEFEYGQEPIIKYKDEKTITKFIVGYDSYREELSIEIPYGTSSKVVATLSDCPIGNLTQKEFYDKYTPIAEEVLTALGYTILKENTEAN